jgi:hypothetical protein
VGDEIVGLACLARLLIQRCLEIVEKNTQSQSKIDKLKQGALFFWGEKRNYFRFEASENPSSIKFNDRSYSNNNKEKRFLQLFFTWRAEKNFQNFDPKNREYSKPIG